MKDKKFFYLTVAIIVLFAIVAVIIINVEDGNIAL